MLAFRQKTRAHGLDVLFDNRFSCIPATEGTRLVGILTPTDFLRAIADGEV